MSWLNERNNEQPVRLNYNYNLMHQCLINNMEIRNKGHINLIKDISNARIMSLNVKGLDPQKCEKIERFIDLCYRIQIDVMSLNEVNLKQTPANADKIEQQMKRLGQETLAHVADDKSWKLGNKNYLPRGVSSAFREKIRLLINEEEV